MGLSDRKVKQRIGADPRNLTWKEDASRFGHAYLAKHGWDPTEGLGMSGTGRTDYLRVAHKLDALGIGAKVGGKEDRDGLAGREFESVLRRLNESVGDVLVVAEDEVVTADGTQTSTKVVINEATLPPTEKPKKKKRKEHKGESGADGADLSEPSKVESVTTSIAATEVLTTTAPAAGSRRLAHRSRFLAAKRQVQTDSRAVAEILGISISSAAPPVSDQSATATPPAFPSSSTPTEGLQTPREEPNEIIKSSLSVADYFKEKMRAKLGLKSDTAPAEQSVVHQEIEVPRGGLGFRRRDVPEAPTAEEPESIPRNTASGLADEPTGLVSQNGEGKTKKKKRRLGEGEQVADVEPEDVHPVLAEAVRPEDVKRNRKKRKLEPSLDETAQPNDSVSKKKKKRKVKELGENAEEEAMEVFERDQQQTMESSQLQQEGLGIDSAKVVDGLVVERENRKKKKRKRTEP